MNKSKLILSCLILLLAGCSFNEAPSDPQANFPSSSNSEINKQSAVPEVIAENLDTPWSIQESQDVFYVSERTGTIAKIENGQVERQQVELKQTLLTQSEAGLLGFVLASDFEESGLAYAYYSYQDKGNVFNRIVGLRLENGIWSEEEVLLDQIPGGGRHDGGRIKIGPDGKLYATTGDAGDEDLPQDLTSLGGKILRLNLDGSIPEDNPYPGSYVYSHGHRNPQGLVWTTEGTMFASEHGDKANDELNRIEAGHNYGWPIIEGTEKRAGMESPLFTSGEESTWAPSGMDMDGEKIYVAALRGATLLEFNVHSMTVEEIVSGVGRIRDVLISEKDVYFVTNNTDGRGSPGEKDDILYKITLPE